MKGEETSKIGLLKSHVEMLHFFKSVNGKIANETTQTSTCLFIGD